MNYNLNISKILIAISFLLTFIAQLYPSLYSLWVNNFYLNDWIYHIFLIQFFIWTFLHWGIFHLLFNSIFIYYFWNIIEIILWTKKYIIFFVFVVTFNGILLSIFSNWNTIWISWFCMALISYYTLELKSKNNPDYKWWITAIVINVLLWFMPWISLLWHLFWAIAWVLYYYLNKNIFRLKLIWKIEVEKS